MSVPCKNGKQNSSSRNRCLKYLEMLIGPMGWSNFELQYINLPGRKARINLLYWPNRGESSLTSQNSCACSPACDIALMVDVTFMAVL